MFSYFRTPDEMMEWQEPDEYPIQTDTPCPTCGRLVEMDGHGFYCEPCQRTWGDLTEVQFDAIARRRYNETVRQINEEERQRVVSAAYEFGVECRAKMEARR